MEGFNISYIINYPSDNRTFGCRRHCSYCNWNKVGTSFNGGFTESKPDPKLGQEAFHLARRTLHPTRKTITISGGGDPLYDPDPKVIPEHTLKLIAESINQGYCVRIITREILKAYDLLKNHPNKDLLYFSFSIDSLMIKELTDNFFICIDLFYRLGHDSTKFEFSCVAPVVPTIAGISDLLREFFALVGKVGKMISLKNCAVNVVIRENLKTLIFEVRDTMPVLYSSAVPDAQAILRGLWRPPYVSLKWLPIYVCTSETIYLLQPMEMFGFSDNIRGERLSPMYSRIFSSLQKNKAIIYGSAAKAYMMRDVISKYGYLELKCPKLFGYHDFDAFAHKNDAEKIIDDLTNNHNMRIDKDMVLDSKIWMRLLVFSTPLDPTFKVTIHCVEDLSYAVTIIFQAELNIDRLFIRNFEWRTGRGFSIKDVIEGVARKLPHRYSYLGFRQRRESQFRHNVKMLQNDVKIIHMKWYHKLLQKFYDFLEK